MNRNMPLVQSEDEVHTNQSRLRSWSMLEMQEMHTIHHLSDNMDSIMVQPSPTEALSKKLKDVNGEDQEPDFLFYDFKDDSNEINDMSTRTNSDANHNFIRKLGWRHKNNSFAFGDGSMASLAIGLDTAHHLHPNLKLDSESMSMDEPPARNQDSIGTMNSHMGAQMLNDYLRAREDQSSPNGVLGVVQIEKNQTPKQPDTVPLPSMDKLAQMMGESGISKSEDSTNAYEPRIPSRKLPALLAPQTIPKLKSVVIMKTPTLPSPDKSDLDASNGSSTVSIGSADGMRKSILKKSSSIGKFSKDIDPSTERETMRRTASFSTLEIRSYDITIGDNPGGSHGAPLSLGWDYNPDNTVKVDLETYEKTRPQRRARSEMYMPSSIRMFLLMKTKGYSLREIEAAAKEAEKFRKKRQKTIKKEQFRQSLGKIFSRSK